MATRPAYLAKSRASASQRAHFAIFVPDAGEDGHDFDSKRFKDRPCKGTVIHVVGEPVMSGFAHEYKRHYDMSTHPGLEDLVLRGRVAAAHMHDSSAVVIEATPRALLEREAAMVKPPPRGQDVRAPVDGAATRRCQEWTIEYLERLAGKHLIDAEAVTIAESQRDPPTHGIFGLKAAVRG